MKSEFENKKNDHEKIVHEKMKEVKKYEMEMIEKHEAESKKVTLCVWVCFFLLSEKGEKNNFCQSKRQNLTKGHVADFP